jgi:hypothetical protein
MHVFDTTSSNTGIHKGACVILERLIERKLLHLACRHHIFELIAKAVFFEIFGTSQAPEVAMFNNFKNGWNDYNKEAYETLNQSLFRGSFARNAKKDVVQFLTKVCSNFS